MAKAQDMNAVHERHDGRIPSRHESCNGRCIQKPGATLNEKLSGVALTAAEKSAEISSKWTKDTLAKLNRYVESRKQSLQIMQKPMTDFASASLPKLAAENVAAFSEIAKKVQMDTVELMMAAGKDISKKMQLPKPLKKRLVKLLPLPRKPQQ